MVDLFLALFNLVGLIIRFGFAEVEGIYSFPLTNEIFLKT